MQSPPREQLESDVEHAPGVVHEQLQGWIPSLATSDEIRVALEKAFDYRGDVTITLKNGQRVEGYVFDRQNSAAELSQCMVRLFPREGTEKLVVPYDQIARLEFSGRDTAAGKSFVTWVKKYALKKAAGETNIRLEPEKLD
jgi:hypothetical protein